MRTTDPTWLPTYVKPATLGLAENRLETPAGLLKHGKEVYRPDGIVNAVQHGLVTLLPEHDNESVATALPARPQGSRRNGRSDTRERILAAAAAVAHEVGPAHLSLDAVAAEAGVSKGGLLYHFPTKQALLVAIIEAQLAAVEQAIEAATRPPGQPNGAARALIEAFRAMMLCKREPPIGVFAALAENPALIEPVRAHNCRTVERLKTSADPERALIAFYAIEGMRALHLFQADPLDQGERDRVLDAIAGLLEAG